MPHSGELWALMRAQTAPAPVTIAPTSSPMTWTATSDGVLALAGGTVSLVEVGRAGVFVLAGVLAGMVPALAGDMVRITYVVAPAMKFLPNR